MDLKWLAEQLDRRRSEPQDDLLTHLLNARLDAADPSIADDRPLDTAEILSIIQQLLVAGNETTTKALAEMMLLLGRHPEEWERLKADPARVDHVVEEVLRLATPVQGMWRLVTTDTELGGVLLPKGSRILAVYASANRDETLYPDPDAFEPDRANLRDHLAFGKGIHFCLGAPLARLEGAIAARHLAQRKRGHRVRTTRLRSAASRARSLVARVTTNWCGRHPQPIAYPVAHHAGPDLVADGAPAASG